MRFVPGQIAFSFTNIPDKEYICIIADISLFITTWFGSVTTENIWVLIFSTPPSCGAPFLDYFSNSSIFSISLVLYASDKDNLTFTYSMPGIMPIESTSAMVIYASFSFGFLFI